MATIEDKISYLSAKITKDNNKQSRFHQLARRLHRTTLSVYILLILFIVDFTSAGNVASEQQQQQPPQQQQQQQDPLVWTRSGQVRGLRSYVPSLGREVDAYLGIPFARPPLGDLRFRHPLPAVPWGSNTYNATKLPSSCFQKPDTEFGDFYGSTVWNSPTPLSEDCLYLNVFVPRLTSSSGSAAGSGREDSSTSTTTSSTGASRRRGPGKPGGSRTTGSSGRGLAVMVWIFGGGFFSGTSTLSIYDGKILASLGEVIVVSIGYRVGALGFLSLGGHNEAPGNAGLFDQLMALDWVRQNIDRFGGDSENITIFGESAGSVSVSLHLLSPLSHGKFDRAIMQSGVANMPWAVTTQTEARRRSLELAFEALHCPRTENLSAVADCLRRIPAALLVNEQWVTRGIMQFPFIPVIDGVFLPDHPDELLQRKEFKRCPILLGSNANEASFFLIYELSDHLRLDRTSMSQADYLVSLEVLFEYYPQFRPHHRLDSRAIEAIQYQYTHWPDVDDHELNINSLDMAVSDGQFVCPLNQFGHRYAQAGLDVFMYMFTQRTVYNPWPEWMGVIHGDEIFIVFGEPIKLRANFTDDERLLARQMITYWTNFAKTGNPNYSYDPRFRSTGPTWPVHTPAGREYLELNSKFLTSSSADGRGRGRPTTDISGGLLKPVGRGPRAKECAFWREYLPNLYTFNDTDGREAMRNTFPVHVNPTPVAVQNVTCPTPRKVMSSASILQRSSFAALLAHVGFSTILVTKICSSR